MIDYRKTAFTYDMAHDSKSEKPDKAAPAYRQKTVQDLRTAKTTSSNPLNRKEYPVGRQSLNYHLATAPEDDEKTPQNL